MSLKSAIAHINQSFDVLKRKFIKPKEKKEIEKTRIKITKKVRNIINGMKKPFEERKKKKKEKFSKEVLKILEEMKRKEKIVEAENKRLKIELMKKTSELTGLEVQIIETKQLSSLDKIIKSHENINILREKMPIHRGEGDYSVIGEFKVYLNNDIIEPYDCIEYYDNEEKCTEIYYEKIKLWNRFFDTFENNSFTPNENNDSPTIFIDGSLFLKKKNEKNIYSILEYKEWSV